MKILYITHQYFPDHVGGTEMFTRGLVRRSLAQGDEVMVLTAGEIDSRLAVEKYQYEGANVVAIQQNLSLSKPVSLNEYSNRLAGQKAEEIIREFQADIIQVMHCMKLSASVLAAACRAAPTFVVLADFWFLCPRHSLITYDSNLCQGPELFKCARCTHHLHGYPEDPKDFGALLNLAGDLQNLSRRKNFLRRCLLKSRRIFALSQFQKDIFCANGYPASRLEILHHGIEPDDLQFEASGPQGEETSACQRPSLKLGFIGSLVPEKGLHVVLDALKEISRSSVSLDIWGSGPAKYGETLKKKSHGLNVRFNGQFAPEKLGEVLESFDALTVPAIWFENNPLVVKAALYLGKPVMASRIGSLPEFINDANGILVNPGDTSSWARAIDNFGREKVKFTFAPVPTMDDTFRTLQEAYLQERK